METRESGWASCQNNEVNIVCGHWTSVHIHILTHIHIFTHKVQPKMIIHVCLTTAFLWGLEAIFFYAWRHSNYSLKECGIWNLELLVSCKLHTSTIAFCHWKKLKLLQLSASWGAPLSELYSRDSLSAIISSCPSYRKHATGTKVGIGITAYYGLWFQDILA